MQRLINFMDLFFDKFINDLIYKNIAKIKIFNYLKKKTDANRWIFFNDLSENRLKSAACAGVFFSIRKHSGLRFAFDSTPKEGEYIMYLNLKYNAPFEGFWICIKLEWLYGAPTRSFFS